jgi:hypothetical protein
VIARRLAPVLLAALACARQAPLPPPPEDLRTVAVPVPQNRTGSELPVAGDWLLERLGLGGARVSVPDLLAGEMRTVLAERGFVVTPPQAEEAPTLQVVLERWEPEVPSLAFVRVTIAVSLLERPGGRMRWSARRARWMVPTRGAPTAAVASTMAARAVVHELFGAWTPEPAPK